MGFSLFNRPHKHGPVQSLNEEKWRTVETYCEGEFEDQVRYEKVVCLDCCERYWRKKKIGHGCIYGDPLYRWRRRHYGEVIDTAKKQSCLG